MHLKLAVMPWGCSSCSSNPWFFARTAWLKLTQPRILSPENGQKATTTLRQGELEVRFAPFSKLTKVTLPKSVSNTYIQGLFPLSSGFSFWSFGQISGRSFERMARLLRISCFLPMDFSFYSNCSLLCLLPLKRFARQSLEVSRLVRVASLSSDSWI